MLRDIFINILLVTFSLTAFSAETYTPGQKSGKTFKAFAQGFINKHCIECHDNDLQKGELSLENIAAPDETNAGLWKTLWAQVMLREMPPKKKSKLEVVDRLLFTDWIVEELKNVNKDKGGFNAHLDPKTANYLDHDLLFGPLPENIRLLPTSTEARLWRIYREEHITRLNELVNKEPEFDPANPGLRTKGDAVPVDKQGQLKIFLGTDLYRSHKGNFGVQSAFVSTLPAIFSTDRDHGLKNYPDFYTVNNSEAKRILMQAEEIIKYMAYGVNSIVVDPAAQVTDDKNAVRNLDKSFHGTPRGVIYGTKTVHPISPLIELLKDEKTVETEIQAAVDHLYEALTSMPPTKEKSSQYVALVKDSIAKLGHKEGSIKGLAAIFLDGNALFRSELAQSGKPDAYGRVMLQDWELGLALNHALRYTMPDAELKNAIISGRMKTKEDVKRELTRILKDESLRKPRILQFFRDYFDYDLAGYVCKDQNHLNESYIGRANWHAESMFAASKSTDRLIELILKEDKDVYRQLMTTDKAIMDTKWESKYFGRLRTKEEITAANKVVSELSAKLKPIDTKRKDLQKLFKENPQDTATKKLLEELSKLGVEINEKLKLYNAQKSPIAIPEEKELSKIYTRVSRDIIGNDQPEKKLLTMPKDQRMGILTHPAWLVSHSDAMENHAVHRGIWVREHLLGGGIPDVPITVDAMLPDEPESTLRHKMRVTKQKYCWQCHEKIDPLGLTFELYNDFGIWRIEDKGKPVDASGEIIDSGVPGLDGKVDNAIDMIQKMMKTDRPEQMFVRYAFRFWIGRNETLNDRPVIQEAYRAYKESGGSMNALIISLLTSDAFLYRKINK